MADKIKIAIIEDDPNLVEIYTIKFTLEGCEVQTAADGDQGLVLISQFKPDIVLLDLMMPNMSGTEMLEKLRQQSGGQDVKVIVLTNINDETTAKRVNKSTPIDYIVKAETTPQEIYERIMVVLGQSKDH